MAKDRQLDAGLRLEARVARSLAAERLFGESQPEIALGSYGLVRRIGEGGTGIVFEARDSRTGQRVAVKVLRRESPEGARRLRREFRAVAELDHPNLVQLYELAEEGELTYIAMELVLGVSLREYARQGGELDVARLREAMAQLVDAVSVLHAAGLLHRDLKPANVLVEASGRVVMLDFDLARPFGELTPTTCSGTPPFVAPERERGLAYDEASDWYSVGMMLHEALTGGLPGACERAYVSRSSDEAAIFALCERLLSERADDRPRAAELRSFCGLPHVARPSSPVRAVSSTGVLIGREAELAELRAAFALSLRGKRVLAHVHGEPGIGKTALAKHCCDELKAWYGAIVLYGRCYEGDQVAFNAVVELIDGLSSVLERFPEARPAASDAEALVRVFPALAPVLGPCLTETLAADVHTVRQRAFAALGSLVSALAEHRPVVIHLDDLQWGDGDSAQLLGELLRAESAAGLLVLASYRSGASEAPCIRSVRELDARALAVVDVAVGPLCDEAARHLASGLCDGVVNERLLQTLRDARGNPLFLRALIEHDKHRAGDEDAATSFRELLNAALERLPEPCRDLLELTVLATRPTERELLLRAANELAADVAWPNHLAQLLRAGLVRGAFGGSRALESYHDRVRETLAGAITNEQRQRYHAALAAAEAIAAEPDPEFLAVHYAGAAQYTEAARYAEESGDRAFNAIALERAAEFYRLALDNLEGRRPPALLEKLANAIAYVGRCEESAPIYTEAASRSSHTETALRLELRAAEMLLRAGRFEASSNLARPVFHALGVRYPKTTLGALASIASSIAQIEIELWRKPVPSRMAVCSRETSLQTEACFVLGYRLSITDPTRACALLARSMRMALREGSESQLARALACYATMLSLLHSRSATRQDRLFADAWNIAAITADSETRGWLLYFRARLLHTRIQYRACVDAIFDARRWISHYSRDAGWLLLDLQSGECIQLMLMAEISALDILSKEILSKKELATRHLLNDVVLTRWIVDIARDRPSRAFEDIEGVLSGLSASELRMYFAAMAIWAKAQTLLYMSRAEDCWSVLQQFLNHFKQRGLSRTHPWNALMPYLRGAAALACAARNNRRPYSRALRDEISRLRKVPSPLGPAFAALLNGGRTLLDGIWDEAADEYGAAADRFEALSMPGFATAARVRQAELVGGPEGRRLHARAAAWFEAEQIANPSRWVQMYAPVAATNGSHD